MGYGWPGNVRELENVIQHAMVMAGGGVILPEHLPIAPGAGPPPAAAGTLEQLVEQKLAECVRGLGRRESANLYDLLIGLVERPLLRAVLRETGGNQLRGRGAPRDQPQHAAQEAPAARAHGRRLEPHRAEEASGEPVRPDLRGRGSGDRDRGTSPGSWPSTWLGAGFPVRHPRREPRAARSSSGSCSSSRPA